MTWTAPEREKGESEFDYNARKAAAEAKHFDSLRTIDENAIDPMTKATAVWAGLPPNDPQ